MQRIESLELFPAGFRLGVADRLSVVLVKMMLAGEFANLLQTMS